MSDRYDELAAKVDDFHGRIQRRYPTAITCRVRCSSCCHQHLSVIPLEFRRIAAAVGRLSDDERAAMTRRLEGGKQSDPRCPLLDDAGQCRVYDARPMICRSHGLPVQFEGVRTVCHLNFPEGPELETLPESDIFSVDSVNAILGVMSHLGGDDPIARVDLFDGLSSLLEDAP